MADDFCDETTIPRAIYIARAALAAVNFSTEDGIVDLIADLMHLADETMPITDEVEDDEEPFTMGYSVMYAARRHYEAELPGEET